jgi:hypothetical protein
MREFAASILFVAVASPAAAVGTLRPLDLRTLPGAGDVKIVDLHDSAGRVTNVVLAAGFNSNRIYPYTIGSDSILVDGVPVDTCDGPRQLALVPKVGPGPIEQVSVLTGCSRSNEVAEYGSSLGGAVNFISKTGSGGNDLADIAVTDDARYAFGANLASNNISVFRRERESHTWSFGGAYTAAPGPSLVDVSRNGIVAVGSTNPGYLGTYRFERATWSLGSVAGAMLAQRPTAMAFGDEIGGTSPGSQLLYVGLRSNQPGIEQDQIATYRVEPSGNFNFLGSTPAGHFLTGFHVTYDRLFAVTIGAGAKDEVRAYKRLGHQLTLDVSYELPGDPGFKQIAVAPSYGRRTTLAVTGFQAGWLRTFEYERDDDPVCVPSASKLCLNDNRFELFAEYRVPSQGLSGFGVGGPIVRDTGYFWFFSPNNVEVVNKVLDGRAFNNSYWVFYGALSDVWYSLSVRDLWSGRLRRYENPQGTLASVGDTSAFPAWSAGGTMSAPGADAESGRRELALGSRAVPFFIRVDWRVPSQGTSGRAQGVVLTSDTAYFWFFSPSNVEVVVKVVDGRTFNGHWWVFYGALSDVEYTITITDQANGAQKVYFNPSGTMASVADTAAF